MGRSRKDPLAADGSGDPAEAEASEEAREDDGEESEEQSEGEEEGGEGEPAVAEDAVEESPPKLAEGYYEIETIRRRRLRKGKFQYLVKWRGWPESANTWEPLENLKACSDIVEAFDKRSFRKRKRKTMVTPTTDPNPSRKRGRPPRSEARSLSRPPAPEPRKLPCRTSSRRGCTDSNKTSFGVLQASANMSGQRLLQEGSSGIVSAGFPSQGTPLSVSLTDQQDEHHPANGLSKVDNLVQVPPSQRSQVTGAKKRKSGCVRRFKQDETTQEQGYLRDRASEKLGNEYVDSTEGETGDKNKGDDCASHVHISRIIKPVRYFATIMDGVQQVSISFKALRSDGEEVLVDDKELKANNPLVLINYYEQHLRYNPTS